MGTLAQHIANHVPLTVSDDSPQANSDQARSNSRADNQHFGGVFTATEESGVIGKANPRPGRINARINGVKVG